MASEVGTGQGVAVNSVWSRIEDICRRPAPVSALVSDAEEVASDVVCQPAVRIVRLSEYELVDHWKMTGDRLYRRLTDKKGKSSFRFS